MAIGIVAEYNPFHRGHEYQIRQAKKQGAELIVILSGSAVQRGELALYDKWVRTRWALLSGADMVLELPFFYSLSSAQGFARGSVASLVYTGLVDTLVFGTEWPDVKGIASVAQIQLEEPPVYRKTLKYHLDKGWGYPLAMAFATRAALPKCLFPPAAFSANSILAIEYTKANIQLGNPLSLQPLYRDTTHFPSARHCRQDILQGLPPDVPSQVQADLPLLFPHRIQSLEKILLHTLRTTGPSFIQSLPDVSEGLENRIYQAACHAKDYHALLDGISGKRYTKSRIRRILLFALLGVTKHDIAPYFLLPSYLRVLGIKKEKRHWPGQIKDTSKLPLILRSKEYETLPLFQKEMLLTDLHSLAASYPAHRDLTTPLIVL